MKSTKLRIIIPLAVLLVVGVGFVTKVGIGTPSAIGWQDISILCPLGALGTMVASKMFIPRALVSLIIAIVLIVVFGRAFCAWVCPVPPISKLRDIFRPKSEQKTPSTLTPDTGELKPLTAEEKRLLGGCADKHTAIDSRHWVLGGALLSTAVFGFPVFCLICPIGLSFATILLILRLFGFGDVTWTIIIVPALLLVEVVFFRKWCHTFCPLGALMSLIAKANRTFRPVINDKKCIETVAAKHCQRCAQVCPEGINPRNPKAGTSWSECTKCRACIEVCPSGALSMPLLEKKSPTEPSSSLQIAQDKSQPAKEQSDGQ